MNPFRQPKTVDEETVEAMAAAWLAQRDEGLTPEEEREFARWQAADRRHTAAVARLERTWGLLQELRDFRPDARAHPDRDLLAPGRSGRARRTRAARSLVPGLLVAALSACIVLAVVWWRRPPPVAPAPARSQVTHYATTAADYQRATLADGSVVELNANSELDVDYTPAARRVRLWRGEAHFTVAKNKARPFLVQAGAVTVRAVGTAFNVRLAPDQVEVLVTEGRVQVGTTEDAGASSDGGPAPNAARFAAGPSLLAAGQRMVIPTAADGIARAAPTVEHVPAAAIREELAWQGPPLVFVDTPLAEVIEEFNQHNRVQLVLGDPKLGALPVAGSFRAENVDAFVRLLEMNGAVQVDRDGPDLIVLRPPPAPRASD